MLKLKHSHRVDEWIVYNPRNFKRYHTHVRHKRVALKIKYLVDHNILPNSKNIDFINSCIRVSYDKNYLMKLEEYKQTLIDSKGGYINE